MTAVEARPDPDPPTPPPARKNGAQKKGTLQKLISRSTSDETGRQPALRRRRMRFLVDHRICDPGGFDEDFHLVIESPSTEVELQAMKKHPMNPAAIPFEMARLCILSCDGDLVRDSDLSRDVLWEALGPLGRALVTKKWNELGGGGAEAEADAVKKIDASTELVI